MSASAATMDAMPQQPAAPALPKGRMIGYFAMVLGMCAVLGATYIVTEKPVEEVAREDGTVAQVARGHGVANPAVGTMLSGGDGAARYEDTWWLGLVFGLFQVVFFVGALAFGAFKRGGLGPLKGKVLRIGLMGHGSQAANVVLLLAALVDLLRKP